MDLRHLELPRITDQDIFEEVCADLLRARGCELVNLNGRRGQRQDGVDVFGRKGPSEWVGVQCKVRDTSLSKSDILFDRTRAQSFNPCLSRLEFFTTARRDAVLQERVRAMNDEPGALTVEVTFWEDIERLVRLPENRNVLRRYFSGVLVDAKALGDAYGTLVSLRFGVDGFFDTCHELMVVVTLPTDRGYDGIDYHRGVHYVVLLNGLIAAKFDPGDVYPTDFERILTSRLDRFMLAKWLNAQDMDDLIFGKRGPEAEVTISREEWSAFHSTLDGNEE